MISEMATDFALSNFFAKKGLFSLYDFSNRWHRLGGSASAVFSAEGKQAGARNM